MNYKYVIILFYENSRVYKVYRLKNKRDLRDYVSHYVESWRSLIVVDKGVFEFSDNDIIKRARKCDIIIDIH